MFSFYGSKSKIIKYYPEPKWGKIIEPFAGSAGYSLKYFDNDIIIADKDKTIIAVWKYLQETTPIQILSLPDVENATELITINGFSQLCQEEKWLIGFCSNGGSAVPKNYSGRHNFNSWNKDKKRIADNLYKIRNWTILNIDYTELTNERATWFIDPPYQDKGKWYKENKIDYSFLSKWCQERMGQIIVCENMGANWLPFEHLKDISFTHFKNNEDKKKKTSEAIWYME